MNPNPGFFFFFFFFWGGGGGGGEREGTRGMDMRAAIFFIHDTLQLKQSRGNNSEL